MAADDPDDDADLELLERAEGLMDNGHSDVLYDALAECPTENARGALRYVMRHVAQNPILGTSAEGAGLQAWLFVVPILFSGTETPPDAHALSAPGREGAYDRMTKAIRAAGLVRAEASVVLLAYLYSLQELSESSLDQVYRLPQRLWRAAEGKPASAAQLLQSAQTGEPPADRLRYLVGMVVDDLDAECFVDEHAEIDEETRLAMARCQQIMDEALAEVVLAGAKASALCPMPFFLGLAEGLFELNQSSLEGRLQTVLASNGMTGQAVETVVSWHEDEKKIASVQVGFESRIDHRLLAYDVIPAQTFIDLLGPPLAGDYVSDLIVNIDTARIVTIEGRHPVEYCECGERLFFNASGALIHPADAAESSVHAAEGEPRILH